MKLARTIWAGLLVASLGSVGCSDDDDNTVLDVARADGNFDTLVAAIERTGLDSTLAGEGPFTVLAPTDAAFELLPDGVIADLEDATLEEILKYHVIPGNVSSTEIVTLSAARTVQGASIAIDADPLLLNGVVQITRTDITADNGTIHVIDAVLLPPSVPFPGDIVQAVAAYPSLDVLEDAVGAANLGGALKSTNEGKGLTLFAPTNQGFADLGVDLGDVSQSDLTNILLYHVLDGTVEASEVISVDKAKTLQGSDFDVTVAGDEVEINNVRLIYVDIFTTNGVVHILRGVLIPPSE